MLRSTALLTTLVCVLLSCLSADSARASIHEEDDLPATSGWGNVTNTTLKVVPDVRLCVGQSCDS